MLALVKRCCLLLHTLALLLPGVARASAPCTPGLTVGFRFHASAPVVDALQSSNGGIAIASVDGYIHALGPNGRFLWSYTLDSPPVGVDMGLDGRVYAASEKGVIHVLRSSGERQWGGQLPSGMVPTGRVAYSERGVVFLPSKLNLYALSVGSGVLWRTFIGSNIVSGPVVSPGGDAWIAAANGEIHRIRTQTQRSKFTLPEAPPTRIVGAGEDRVFLLDASGLTARGVDGRVLWYVPGVERASVDVAVVRMGDTWVWLDDNGQRKGERQLELDVSAEATHADGLVYVPTTDGRLYVFAPDGEVEWCQVAHAPLLMPQVYAKGPGVVASGDGWLVSIHHRNREGKR